MEVNEMQKWNIAHRINTQYDFTSIIMNLENVERDSKIEFIKQSLLEEEYIPFPKNLKIAIIDFEGSPVFMCGIMIQNTIFTYYIKESCHKIELYKVIFKILQLATDLSVFAFSDYERLQILNMYHYLQVQGKDVSELNFIKEFPIINLQKENSRYESLSEAFYAINPNSEKLTRDSLFRNNKLINQLFSVQKFGEIISHNRNCLLIESSIFQKRWYKNFKL